MRLVLPSLLNKLSNQIYGLQNACLLKKIKERLSVTKSCEKAEFLKEALHLDTGWIVGNLILVQINKSFFLLGCGMGK